MISYEISSLDHSFLDVDGFKGTVHECLMWIKSQEHPQLSQFVNVTSQYNGTGVIFTFIPQLESEARSIVVSIIPYFCYEYGNDMKKYFKPDAWLMHEDTQWDPDLRVAIGPDDMCINAITDQDMEYQWEDEEVVPEITNIPRCPMP